jgi:chromosome segregation ATPase
MTRTSKVLIVLVVATLGVWGCAQGPVSHSAQGEKIRSLESKCAKLEEDYRAVAAARDQARKRATTLEADLRKEAADRQAAERERDELRAQVKARTGERDNLQTRCDRLKKGLQTLLGEDAALAAPEGHPVTAAPQGGPTLPGT